MSGRPSTHPGSPDPIPLFRQLEALKTEEPALAQPMDRMVARVIDFVCIGVIFTVVSFGLYALMADPEPNHVVIQEEGSPNTAESWIAVASGATAVGLFLLLSEVRPGWRTPGKRFLSLYIVQTKCFARPAPRQALVRCAAWAVPVLGAFLFWQVTFPSTIGLLGILMFALSLVIPGWMYRDNDHRGLHDRLAGTRVVADRH